MHNIMTGNDDFFIIIINLLNTHRDKLWVRGRGQHQFGTVTSLISTTESIRGGVKTAAALT